MKAGMTRLFPAVIVLVCLVPVGTLLIEGGDEQRQKDKNASVDILGKDILGAEVFVRGEKIGVISNTLGELAHFSAKIAPGRAPIELKKDGRTLCRREIRVEKGSDYCIEFSPEDTAAGPADSDAIFWRDDPVEALRLAARQDKPLILDFNAPWCGWCQKLDSEVYTDPAFRKEASRFIALKINTDQRKDVAARYKVRNLPTVVFLDSSGSEIDRITGFRSSAEFCKAMSKIAPEESTVGAVNAGTGTVVASDSAVIIASFKETFAAVLRRVYATLDDWAK